MTEVVDNPPDASRVITSLRDTGYSFETAVADLADNSIAAGANKVDIRVEMDYGGDVHFSIVDNGSGMTRSELIAAMRYGAPQQPNQARLGKFGLGLKTASTAFCRRLEVTTRRNGNEPAIAACWDLDSIAAKNSWALELPRPSGDAIALIDETAPKASGTAVVWANVDRFFGRQYKNRGGTAAQRALERKVEELSAHLGVTFQRFIEGTAKNYSEKLAMTINGATVDAWDPFCSLEEKADAKVHPLEIEITRGNQMQVAQAVLRTVILPAQSEFSTKEAYERARISLEYQGVYVYRHDRLLTHGNWLKMYAVHGSHNMLRVELSFDYMLDDVFSVPVDKSNIEIDPEFADELKTNYLHVPIQDAERRRAGAESMPFFVEI